MTNGKLSQFEGNDVSKAGIEIPGAGGGLRDALDIEPRELHHTQEVYVVLHLATKKIRFDPIKDSDGALMRVHVMDVLNATFVDRDLVNKQLTEQRQRVELAKREAEVEEGKPELPFADAVTPARFSDGLPDEADLPVESEE